MVSVPKKTGVCHHVRKSRRENGVMCEGNTESVCQEQLCMINYWHWFLEMFPMDFQKYTALSETAVLLRVARSNPHRQPGLKVHGVVWLSPGSRHPQCETDRQWKSDGALGDSWEHGCQPLRELDLGYLVELMIIFSFRYENEKSERTYSISQWHGDQACTPTLRLSIAGVPTTTRLQQASKFTLCADTWYMMIETVRKYWISLIFWQDSPASHHPILRAKPPSRCSAMWDRVLPHPHSSANTPTMWAWFSHETIHYVAKAWEYGPSARTPWAREL